jgi:hypothetical protein
MKRALAAATLVSCLFAGILACAAQSFAHGGYPTRLGVRQDPDLVLLARLVLVYLVDGEGMNVHLTVFEDGSDPGREYASGEIDLFLDMPSAEGVGGDCRAVGEKGWLDASYPGSWAGLFGFHIGEAPCRRPALIAHSKVAVDLRFTLLQETLEGLLGAITLADLEQLREEGAGSTRDAAAEARRILKEKGLL